MASYDRRQPLLSLVHAETRGGALTEESLVRLRDNPYSDPTLRFRDYGIEKEKTLTATQFDTNISAFWVWATETWDEIARKVDGMSISQIRSKWALPFFRYLGYDPVFQRSNEVIEGPTKEQSFSVNLSHRGWDFNGAPRIHVILSSERYDSPVQSDRNEISPHDAMQRFLVLSREVDWGVLFNGRSVRLLRKYYHEYTRGYLEFDLENILEDRNLTEFRLMYLILHASSYRIEEDEEPRIEGFYERSRSTGIKIGDRLRDNVKEALELLANDLLTEEDVRDSEEDPGEVDEFFSQLLRVFYGIMFILYAEQRGMLPGLHTLYGREYSITKLRGMAERPIRVDVDVDLWRGLQRTFRLVEKGARELGIYPYNGDLFNPEKTWMIEPLTCRNDTLLRVILLLTTTRQDGVLSRISYVDIDVEEIGSVYESLLDYKPSILTESRVIDQVRYQAYRFYLIPRGLERKTTGSYYTNKGLVNILVKTALVPVVKEKLRKIEDGFQDTNSQECLELMRKTLLDVKVCDPACGGGTFLIAALDYLGLRYAQLQSGLQHPSEDELREARRTVLMHCIYAVDKNPLAVELAKISLWLHASVKDKPLNFLDHKIKCGDSLIGARPNVVQEGIIPDAFKALKGQSSTGLPAEDNSGARVLRKRTMERKKRARGISSLSDYFESSEVEDYIEDIRALEALSEDSPEEVDRKAQLYREILGKSSYQHQKDVYDTWVSSFFWPLTSELKGVARFWEACPTETSFREVIRNRGNPQLIQKVRELSEEYRFFNWDMEFPEVFGREDAGFGCILTNPPWEVMQLKENEFFTGKSLVIEEAGTQAIRRRKIKALLSGTERDRKLHLEYSRAWYQQKKTYQYLRNSGLFPLSAQGTLNTYQLFVERCWRLLSSTGRAGMVVPTGIVTGFYLKDLFAELVEQNSLCSLFDFENNKQVFPIHRQFRFSLLTISGPGRVASHIPMSFYNLEPSEVEAQLEMIPKKESEIAIAIKQLPPDAKLFAFVKEDFEALNPNTLTCPIFRTRRDAELTRHLYQQAPLLIRKDRRTGKITSNPWKINFFRMCDMATDSELFKSLERLKEIGAEPIDPEIPGGPWKTKKDTYLPLYEGKMMWYYDHRYNSVVETTGQQATGKETTIVDYQDPNFFPTPRYWVKENEIEQKIPSKYKQKWFIGIRRYARSTDAKTIISSIIPRYGVGDQITLVIFDKENETKIPLLLSNLSTIIIDYIAKQKMGGSIAVLYYILEQLPLISLNFYNNDIENIIKNRVIELTYSSKNMEEFAKDYGYDGPPFTWEKDRRDMLISELDAIYAKIYKVSEKDLDYILEQCIVLKNNELREYGEYRTKRLILEAYNRLAPKLEEMLSE